MARAYPSLKQRFQNGEQLYGCGLLSCSTAVLELLAHGGYDFVMIDCEHSPADFMFAQTALQTLNGLSTAGIVRIPTNDPTMMKKALGIGPAGVVVPMVETAAEASQAVASFRYVPHGGSRGAGWGAERCALWGLDKDYPRRYPDDTLLVLMIESPKGFENIAEISKVEGFDFLMLGPRDMATSLGSWDTAEPSCVAYFKRVEEEILRNGKWLGGGGVIPGSTVPEMFARGYKFVIGMNDTTLIRAGAVADVAMAKAGLPITPVGGEEGATTC